MQHITNLKETATFRKHLIRLVVTAITAAIVVASFAPLASAGAVRVK